MYIDLSGQRDMQSVGSSAERSYCWLNSSIFDCACVVVFLTALFANDVE